MCMPVQPCLLPCSCLLPFYGPRRGDIPDLTADPTLAEELGFCVKQDLTTMRCELADENEKSEQVRI
jgi:hypothetical protein